MNEFDEVKRERHRKIMLALHGISAVMFTMAAGTIVYLQYTSWKQIEERLYVLEAESAALRTELEQFQDASIKFAETQAAVNTSARKVSEAIMHYCTVTRR